MTKTFFMASNYVYCVLSFLSSECKNSKAYNFVHLYLMQIIAMFTIALASNVKLTIWRYSDTPLMNDTKHLHLYILFSSEICFSNSPPLSEFKALYIRFVLIFIFLKTLSANIWALQFQSSLFMADIEDFWGLDNWQWWNWMLQVEFWDFEVWVYF